MSNQEQAVIDNTKAWFDRFPYMKFLPIQAWGTYYKYELRGETYEDLYEPVDDLAYRIDHLGFNFNDAGNQEAWEVIAEEEESYPGWERKYLKAPSKYESDSPGTCLVVVRDGDELKLKGVRYDPE